MIQLLLLYILLFTTTPGQPRRPPQKLQLLVALGRDVSPCREVYDKHIHIYIYTYAYMYVYIYAHIFTYTHIHIYTYTCIHILPLILALTFALSLITSITNTASPIYMFNASTAFQYQHCYQLSRCIANLYD